MKVYAKEYAYLARSAGTPKAVRMVKVSPVRLAPANPDSASVLAPDSGTRMSVAVPIGDGSFLFEFALRDGDWVGEYARAVRPWTAVTAVWLAGAWEVAAEALRLYLSGTAQPQDVRCRECGRVVPVPAGAPGPVAEVLCGTEHVLTFGGEKAAVVDASGTATWALVK